MSAETRVGKEVGLCVCVCACACTPLIVAVDMRLSELVHKHDSECVLACGGGGSCGRGDRNH